MGEMNVWQRWEWRKECDFDGSGYDQVLIDAIYYGRNVKINILVYYQLKLETFGGTEHHLVKKY